VNLEFSKFANYWKDHPKAGIKEEAYGNLYDLFYSFKKKKKVNFSLKII
jgi:hypothetical protein